MIFRRGFCTAKSQLSRHGYISFSKTALLTGLFLGGGAGGVLGGTIFMQSSEINSLGTQLIEKRAELKASEEALKKLTNKSNREKKEYEESLASKDEEISGKESELADAQSTIESKNQALNAQDAVLTQTKNKLNETSKQHARLQRRHKDLKSIKTKLTGDLTNCVKTRETTVERLQREKKELQDSMKALNTRANNLENVIGNLRDELRVAKRQMN